MSLHRVVRDVFVYGAGDLLLRATAFITLPIYTRILTPADYGVWAYVGSGVSLLTSFSDFSSSDSVISFPRRISAVSRSYGGCV